MIAEATMPFSIRYPLRSGIWPAGFFIEPDGRLEDGFITHYSLKQLRWSATN